ncbi:hypothetical protein GCM10009837_67320 [Streptomyces durmitorensis]|uniref:Uncharacterized protein n=1 Tax=Streptomyces durmitorensis TaxID=319947 RepID=A0ABY4Q568_9ACTN|nr:hypothetical protein [Streptomyces durmitorensis]UQT61217.1 hypothetical protein M4V62_42515 [Streptomyces durmitorensis]
MAQAVFADRLCAAGSPECAEYIADMERQLAKAEQEGEEDGVLGFSRVRVGSEDDCRDEFRNHFGGDR